MPSSKKHLLKLFLKQLFDVGNSTGSLFSEALGIFRTFQRFSASQSFSTRFSDQCLKLFEWAKNIYGKIISFIPMDPLTDFEYFYLYSFAFPLMMLVFISAILSNYNIFLFFLVYGLFFMLGAGISYIGINNITAIVLIIISVIIITIGIIFRKKGLFFGFQIFENFTIFCNKKNETKGIDLCEGVEHWLQFSFSVFATFATFSLIMIPILSTRPKLSIYLMIFTFPIFGLCIIIEIIALCCWKSKQRAYITKFAGKIINFLINLFTLLIIPSTEYFVKIMQESYKNNWNCIVSYIGNSLLLPILSIFLLVKNNAPDIQDKYIQSQYGFLNFNYIEIIDVVKQVSYALFAAYDIYYGCILLEIVWTALILSLLPYQNKSDYSLSLGNSLLMFISNGAMIYSSLNDDAIFSFPVSIVFTILACTPAIASLYIYFIFDFDTKGDEKSEDSNNEIGQSEKKEGIDQITYNMKNSIIFLTPIAWFFYGLSISLISKKINL